MNGFKPMGDIQEWHVVGCMIFTIIGFISVVYLIIKGITWLFNHVQFI